MPPTPQDTDYDVWITQGERLNRALAIHHLPDIPAIRRAREALRAALQREPEHRTWASAVRFRRRILDQFDRAVERAERYSYRDPEDATK